MRSYNSLFSIHNRAKSKAPYWVVEIAFDRENTDLVYLTSHAEAQVPSGAVAIHRVVDSISGTSQRVHPIEGRATIGDITVDLVDRAAQLTELFRDKLLSEGKGLREKRVRVYKGFEGLSWESYELVQTQIVSGRVQYDQGGYRISCSDIQRSARKDIFLSVSTRLRETVSQDTSTIPVINTARLNQVEHGHSYTDAPPYSVGTVAATNGSTVLTGAGTQFLNRALEGGRILIDGQSYLVSAIGSNTSITLATPFSGSTGSGKGYVIYPKVGYIKIDDELICYPVGGIETNELRFCRRGVMGSRSVEHQVGDNVEDDRKPRVDDVMYLEMPIPKLSLALLTGDLWGQPGQRLPDGWHLDIDPQYIRTSDFLVVGDDIWDPDDDNAGRSLRFVAESQQDAKRFIESQVNRTYGAFNPVYRDGSLGLRRITAVLEDAPHVRVLDETLLTGHSALVHDKAGVHNQFQINWNYDPVREDLTRSNFLPDAHSIQRHGGAPVMEIDLRGLHGARHDQDTLVYVFDALRSRHAGPPLRMNVRALPSMNDLEVGDIIRLRHSRIRDYNGEQVEVDRAFEIQSVSIDWMNGDVSFDLFGSSQEATPQQLDGVGVDASPSGWYTSQGTNLQTLLGQGFEVSGDIGRIVADATLTGGANMNAAGSIFYYDGSLEVAPGVTLTIEGNVQIRCRGFFTVNGAIDGSGRGTPASLNGTIGYIGTTNAGGRLDNVTTRISASGGNVTVFDMTVFSSPAPVAAAPRASLPQSFNLRWTEDGTLAGIPSNLRGTSGGQGSGFQMINPFAGLIERDGGAGGDGGAGLAVVCRGADMGANRVNLSGADGALGESYSYVVAGLTFIRHAGAGGGGAPGGCLVILDDSGGLTLAPSATGLDATQGASPLADNAIVPSSAEWTTSLLGATGPVNIVSHYVGRGVSQHRLSHFRVQALPDHASTPSPDLPTQADRGQAINIDEHANRPQTPNQNLVTLEVSVTPPAQANNYAYSNIYYRRLGDAAFIPAGPASPEAVIVVTMDGTEYEIIARPVSIFYIESQDYISTIHQVPIGSGHVVIDDEDNFIATSPTVGQGSNGQGVTYGAQGIRGYDNAGNLKTWIDPTTGLIMAVDGDFSGKITASEGEIGGWEITEGGIEKGGVHLDSVNEMITVGDNIFIDGDGSGVISVGDKVYLDGAGGGSLSVSQGLIGGWEITEDGIQKGTVMISAAQEYIQVGGAQWPSVDNFVRLDADGLLGYDEILGVTFRIPTDGSSPMFSGGVIKETLFEVTSASVIRTSETVGEEVDGQGIILSSTGLRGYDSSGELRTFINPTTGEIHAEGGHFSGEVTGAVITGSILRTENSGERIVVNENDDNRIRFFDSSNNQMVTVGFGTGQFNQTLLSAGSGSFNGRAIGALNGSNQPTAYLENTGAGVALDCHGGANLRDGVIVFGDGSGIPFIVALGNQQADVHMRLTPPSSSAGNTLPAAAVGSVKVDYDGNLHYKRSGFGSAGWRRILTEDDL